MTGLKGEMGAKVRFTFSYVWDIANSFDTSLVLFYGIIVLPATVLYYRPLLSPWVLFIKAKLLFTASKTVTVHLPVYELFRDSPNNLTGLKAE